MEQISQPHLEKCSIEESYVYHSYFDGYSMLTLFFELILIEMIISRHLCIFSCFADFNYSVAHSVTSAFTVSFLSFLVM